jgi:malate dehydrogenase (oxaloacetate-decarboxylating)
VALTPSASCSLTIRAAIKNRPGMLGRLTSAIGEAGGDILAVDLVDLVKDLIVRDFTINARDEPHGQAIVRVMATGRSDYPNQINNVLCLPGFFRGLLDCRAMRVTDEMKIAAARAIVSVVSRKQLQEEYIIPSVFNKKVARAVAHEVVRAAQRGGLARRRRRPAH